MIPAINTFLLVAAFICLLLAAWGVSHPRINFGWLGLALWVLTIALSTFRA